MVDFCSNIINFFVGGSCKYPTNGNGLKAKKKIPVIPAWSLAVVMNDDEWFWDGANSSMGEKWRQPIIVMEGQFTSTRVMQIFASETRSEFANHKLRCGKREFSRFLMVRSQASGQSFSVDLFWNIEDGFSRTSNLLRKSGYFRQSWLKLLHKSMKTTTGCQNHNSVSSRSYPKLFIHVITYIQYVQGPGSTDHTFGYFDKVLSHFSVFKH